MSRITKSIGLAAVVLALGSTSAAAAPGASTANAQGGPAECEVFGTPLSGGACIQWEKHGKLNGSAYNQNCALITGNEYPFTFYPNGGPFPPTTVNNLGECKKALRFFHSSINGAE